MNICHRSLCSKLSIPLHSQSQRLLTKNKYFASTSTSRTSSGSDGKGSSIEKVAERYIRASSWTVADVLDRIATSSRRSIEEELSIRLIDERKSAFDAARVMAETNSGSLIVVKEEKDDVRSKRRLTGIITERDYIRKVVLEDKKPKETAVSKIMTESSKVKVVTPLHTVQEAMKLMKIHQFRNLPVVSPRRLENECDNFRLIDIAKGCNIDIIYLTTRSIVEAVILHEMGHVIGIGTLWDYLKLYSGRKPALYNGAGGIAGLEDVGGTGKPVVEEDGGDGTAFGHWDDTTYKNELLTGYINSGSNPLSMMTLKSLRDLGFTVDPSQADSYTVPTSGRRMDGSNDAASQEGGMSLQGDVIKMETAIDDENHFGLDEKGEYILPPTDVKLLVSLMGSKLLAVNSYNATG